MRRSSMILAVTLSVGAMPAAWSSEDPAPPTPASAAAESTAAPQPTSAAPGAAAGVTIPATQAANTAADAKPGSGKEAGTEVQIRELRSRGYKAENRNGTTVWCRTETTMGTRFETKKCATADDLDMARQRGKDFTSTIQNYGLPKGKP
jgi:hypothetical protein